MKPLLLLLLVALVICLCCLRSVNSISKDDLFWRMSDSMNVNRYKAIEQAIKGDTNSRRYYDGKADAYWEIEIKCLDKLDTNTNRGFAVPNCKQLEYLKISNGIPAHYVEGKDGFDYCILLIDDSVLQIRQLNGQHTSFTVFQQFIIKR